MTDAEKLEALLADKRLTARQREAFESMQVLLESSDEYTLTHSQREWIDNVGQQLGVLVDVARNDFSAGKVPRGIAVPKSAGEEKAATLLAKPLPKLPPGRRA